MEITQRVDFDVVVSIDSNVWQLDTRARGVPPVVGGLTGAPVSRASADHADPRIVWLLERLAADREFSVKTTVAVRKLPGAATRALDRTIAPELRVDLGDGESAVVLVESEGVVGWQFPEFVEAASPAAGAAVVRGHVQRQARFRIVAPGGATETTSAQRGAFTDWLLDGVKATVLKFVARKAIGTVVEALERNKRTGPVVLSSPEDPGAWQKPGDFARLVLPQDRVARVLLFVHGTFSSTGGGFGELCATPWGRLLLQNAAQHYDAVIGFDHRTLSVDPLENARDLYVSLRTLKVTTPPALDIVCHSRGGLVVRSLIEQLLPKADWRPPIGRVVFAAATNAGTQLARPENWHSLVDLVTNLALAAQTVMAKLGAPQVALVAGEIVDGIGDFVRYLVDAAVEERRAPGIAAMNPDGDFVRTINLTEPGAPKPQDARYFAIQSNFTPVLFEMDHQPKEFPRRLALMLANGFIDALMKDVANDLVVDVPSMTSIDAAVGGYVKEVKDFGTNPLVYHTNYFLQPEVVDAVSRWLALPASDASFAVEDRLASRDFIVVDALTPTREVVRAAASARAAYVVICRRDPHGDGLLHYAPTCAEILAAAASVDPSVSITNAMQLHEWQQSATAQRGGQSLIAMTGTRASVATGLPAFSQRTVLMHGNKAVAVMGADIPDIDVLANAAAAAESVRAVSHAPSEPSIARRGLRTEQRQEQQAQRPILKEQQGQGAKPPNKASVASSVCHATAEMPAEVELGKTTTVTVTLAAEEISTAGGPATASGEFVPQPGKPILVLVLPKLGFVLASDRIEDSQAEFAAPPAPGAPYVLDVDVRATDSGPGEVWVIVRQGPLRALTLALRPTVFTSKKANARAAVATSGSVPGGADFSDVPTLEIAQRQNGNETRFMFRVNVPGVALNRFESAPIQGDLQAWIEDLYQGIEKAWLGSGRMIEIFQDSLRATGDSLFRQLVPQQLRALLWQLRLEDRLKSILVLSDEPFVPWEIVYLDDPQNAGHARACFLGELGLCRWLYGAVPVARIEVRPKHARYVIPHYPDKDYRLAAAETVEEPLVRDLLKAVRVEPHYAAVKALLGAAGETDLLHFAGHGGAELRSIDNAAVLLEGDIQMVEGAPQYVTEPLLAKTVAFEAKLRGSDGRRPLVVFNACQIGRPGFSLTSMGGFAAAFLGTREGESDAIGKAGAFVGSLWSVGDAPATDFVRGFYGVLKTSGGATMAEAVIAGRQAARAAEDATWLAYTVYAHPNCHVVFQ